MLDENLKKEIIEVCANKLKFRGSVKENYRSACELYGMANIASMVFNISYDDFMELVRNEGGQ